MARYIDAEQMKIEIRIAMAEQLHKDPFNTIPTQLAELLCEFVDDTPTADVEEVRHGKWTQSEYDRNTFVCSECGKYIQTTTEPRMYYPYCHCGAKMDVRYTE